MAFKPPPVGISMAKFKHVLSRVNAFWWFLLLFILMSLAYEAGRVLHLPPQPHHLWRQADCISLAWNYYDTTWNLFQPTIHNLFSDNYTTGKSAGEFPGLYWLVGMLWRITGPSWFSYRLIEFLIHFLGTLALFASVRRILQSGFWAMCVALLFYASPAIVYFGIGFLTDVPAFDLVLIAWWFVVRYVCTGDIRQWRWAACFFALAMLIKVSAGLSFVALSLGLLFRTLLNRRPGRASSTWPNGSLQEWLPVALGFAAVFAWYAYADQYNQVHWGKYTFNGLWPIWGMNPEERAETWKVGKEIVVFQVFDTSVWLLLGICASFIIFHIRMVPRDVRILNLFLIMGSVAFTLMWFHAVDNHDYYFINPMMTLVVLLITALWLLRTSLPKLFHSPWIRAGMLILLAYNVAYTAQNMQMRYDTSGTMTDKTLLPIYHEAELAHWNALSYWNLENIIHIQPELRRIGIQPQDRVIFPDDPTINGSLIFMGNRGWTGFGEYRNLPGWVPFFMDRGAKYFLCVDPKWTWEPNTAKYLHDRMAVINGVSIYRLHPTGPEKPATGPK